MFPIYVPTKGRAEHTTTIPLLEEAGLDYSIVVEKSEIEAYAERFNSSKLLCLPEENKGLWYARYMIKEDAQMLNLPYHWQIDDNIKRFGRFDPISGKTTRTNIKEILEEIETTVLKYTNVAVASPRHSAWSSRQRYDISINSAVYSCMLVKTDVNAQYRDNVVEDTDYTLQILSQQYCSLTFNRLIQFKATVASMPGGDTEQRRDVEFWHNRNKGLQRLWGEEYFKVYIDEKGMPRVKPSHIWRKFKHVPIPVEGLPVPEQADLFGLDNKQLKG